MSYKSKFSIENDGYSIDEFIQKNNIPTELLDELYDLINLNLSVTDTPILELVNLGDNWNTLFIRVNTTDDYSIVGDFYTKFIDTLVKYPSTIEYLNIDLKKEEVETPAKMIDWNELTLDQMVEYLKQKHQFSSTGETKCILSLIDFYEKNKNNSISEITDDQLKSIIELTAFEDSVGDVWGKDTYLGTMDELIQDAKKVILF